MEKVHDTSSILSNGFPRQGKVLIPVHESLSEKIELLQSSN